MRYQEKGYLLGGLRALACVLLMGVHARAAVTPVQLDPGEGGSSLQVTNTPQLAGRNEQNQRSTLEQLEAFSFVQGSEATYRQVGRMLAAQLEANGFKRRWTRSMSQSSAQGVEAWYAQDLNMTVLCMSWSTAQGYGQRVTAIHGTVHREDFLPLE